MPGGFIPRDIHQPWWVDVTHILIPMLMLLGIVALGVWTVLQLRERRSSTTPTASVQPDMALEETRLRYARGEMDRDEFLQRTRDLGGAAPGTDPIRSDPGEPT